MPRRELVEMKKKQDALAVDLAKAESDIEAMLGASGKALENLGAKLATADLSIEQLREFATVYNVIGQGCGAAAAGVTALEPMEQTIASLEGFLGIASSDGMKVALHAPKIVALTGALATCAHIKDAIHTVDDGICEAEKIIGP